MYTTIELKEQIFKTWQLDGEAVLCKNKVKEEFGVATTRKAMLVVISKNPFKGSRKVVYMSSDGFLFDVVAVNGKQFNIYRAAGRILKRRGFHEGDSFYVRFDRLRIRKPNKEQ